MAELPGDVLERRAQDHAAQHRPLGHVLRDMVKGGFDRLAAVLGLVLLLPLLLIVAGAIYLRDPGPVLYAHRRIGRGGHVFRCLKFRTMVLDGDAVLARHLAENPSAAREWAESRKLRQDPRVTRLGARLRRSSIDELPQLINVLKGEMSLVGPRPIVLDEARYYGAALGDYLSVKPGLTGLWQISGRSDTSYAERVALDSRYVRERGFWGDLAIILRTVAVVLRGRGSY
jgi:exopolysaccharide production protein ExoY